MFSSTNVPIHNLRIQENDSLVARKPGQTNALSRKALQDRAVNERSVNRNINQNSFKKVETPKEKKPQVEYPDWLLDVCSYNEVKVKDTYEDIWPQSQQLHQQHFTTIVGDISGRSQSRTPPPKKFDIDPMFFEIPQDLFFKSKKHEPFVFEEEEDEVSLPTVTFEDFAF